MATAPLSSAAPLVTQEMASIQTLPLGADVVTASIKKAESEDTQTAMLPDNPSAETEVLDTPAAPISDIKATAPSAVSAPLPAPSAPAKPGNKLGLISIAALVLCALIGGIFYLMRPAVAPVVETTTNVSVNETEPIANENANLPTDTASTALMVAPLTDKPASPRPTSSPLAGKVAVTKPAENIATTTPTPVPAPALTYGTELPKPTEKTEPSPKPASTETVTNYLARGTQFLSAKQFPEAIAAFQRAHKADPSNVDLHYLMGSAYHQMGQLNEALAQYRQCTSGNYASVASNHVKNLEKKLKKGQ